MSFGDDWYTTTPEAAAWWEEQRSRDEHEDDRREARADARREAQEDAADDVSVTCSDCGERWDPGHRPATRTDPAYEMQDCCPYCGGDRVTVEEMIDALSRAALTPWRTDEAV